MATKRQVTLRAQWIGKTFKELRQRNGMTMQEVAEYLGRDQSSLSRFEAGIHPPRKDDVVALMDLFGVEEESQRQATLHMVGEVSKTGWWAKHAKDASGWFMDLLWVEERAEALRLFSDAVVPGLLQTPEYAEALMKADDPCAAKQQIKRGVDLRVKRQQILDREGFQLSLVLDEAVIRRPVGGRQVMAVQIAHLISSAQRENLDIRVLPFSVGAHCGGAGAFRLILMPEPFPVIAYIESPGGALFVEASSADDLADRYDRLHQGSLDAQASIDFLREVEQELQ
ncbi:helix-turn-helix domain-containing protein [Nocardiopsis terrae]